MSTIDVSAEDAIEAAVIEADQRIDDGDFATAADLLAAARSSHPDALPLELAQGRLLEATDKRQAATALYRDLHAKHPVDPWPLAGLARVALARGATDKAAKLLNKARKRGLPRADRATVGSQIAEALKQEADAGRAADASIDARLGHARAAVKVGDLPLARDTARQVIDSEPQNIEALGIVGECAFKLGDVEQAASAYERLAELDPQNPDWAAWRVRMMTATGDLDGAIALLRAAAESFPDSIELFRYARQISLPPDLAGRAVALASAITAEDPKPLQRIAASILLRSGKDLPEGLKSQYSRTFAPAGASLKRALVDDQGEAVTIARADAPAPLVIVFTGLADQAQMPIREFDRNLAALGVSAIYLRDRARCIFLKGIPGVAPDRDAAVAMLRDLIADIAPTRLVTIGSSSGGHAAIGYGIALGADTIIGFSAATNITPAFLEADGRGRALAYKLSQFPAELLDPLPALRACETPPVIHLVYGIEHPQDPMHADYLAREEGVFLHALDDVEAHPTLPVMASRGDLLPFLAGIVTPGPS